MAQIIVLVLLVGLNAFFAASEMAFVSLNDTKISVKAKEGDKKYKKIERIPCILSDHHRLSLVFNSNKNNRKPTYTWKLNNALLSDPLVKEEIKKLKTF